MREREENRQAVDDQVRIICVDDEQNVLKALERLFIDTDYRIFTASSGEKALEYMNSGAGAQIVISDYRMPGMNGVDFLKQVCRLWPETVRIILSGYADTAAVVASINEGQIYKFIPKPWNDEEMKISIANAVEKYFLQSENRKLLEELKQKNELLERANCSLGRIVAENTSHLIYQNKIFRCSHDILMSLPVAVFGLNSSYEIIMCNHKSAELFGVKEFGVKGKDSREIFPEELNIFVGEVLAKKELTRMVPINGVKVKARGVTVGKGGDKAITLLLDWE
jgi:two-component system NtrC family sensor kinase